MKKLYSKAIIGLLSFGALGSLLVSCDEDPSSSSGNNGSTPPIISVPPITENETKIFILEWGNQNQFVNGELNLNLKSQVKTTLDIIAKVNGEAVTPKVVVEDESVLTVDNTSFEVTPLKSGRTKITITIDDSSNDKTLETYINVFEGASFDKVEISSSNVKVGDQKGAIITSTIANQNASKKYNVVYKAADSTIIDVTPIDSTLNALVIGLKDGKSNITVNLLEEGVVIDTYIFKDIISYTKEYVISYDGGLKLNYTSEEAKTLLTDEEIFKHFIASSPIHPEYKPTLAVKVKDTTLNDKWNNKEVGSYTIIVYDSQNVDVTSQEVTVNIQNVSDKLSFIFYNPRENYDDYTSMYFFASGNINVLITGVQSQDGVPSVTFREEVYLDESGNVETSKDDSKTTYKAVRFNLDSTHLFTVSNEWNNSNPTNQKLNLADLNSGLILRNQAGDKQTQNLYYDLSKVDSSNPVISIFDYSDNVYGHNFDDNFSLNGEKTTQFTTNTQAYYKVSDLLSDIVKSKVSNTKTLDIYVHARYDGDLDTLKKIYLLGYNKTVSIDKYKTEETLTNNGKSYKVLKISLPLNQEIEAEDGFSGAGNTGTTSKVTIKSGFGKDDDFNGFILINESQNNKQAQTEDIKFSYSMINLNTTGESSNLYIGLNWFDNNLGGSGKISGMIEYNLDAFYQAIEKIAK